MTFAPKRIEITIQLTADPQTNQPGTFAESGSDTVTLAEARTSVRIQNSGSLNGSTAQVDVYGLTPSMMDQLSTLGLVFNIVTRNKITIAAGDAGGQMTTVFTGIIWAAYGDFNQAPDVPFHMECLAGLADSTANAKPTSYAGTVDVATLMSGFATAMNLGFENSGVSVQISNPYYAGNVWQQVQKAAADAHINADRISGGPAGEVLAIWPKGSNRNTPNVPLLAPQPAGTMIGYPSYTQQGIMVRNLWNPQITRGTLIQVQSSLKKANGQWAITKLDHALDAMIPHGEWSSTMYCYNPKYPQPIAPGSQ